MTSRNQPVRIVCISRPLRLAAAQRRARLPSRKAESDAWLSENRRFALASCPGMSHPHAWDCPKTLNPSAADTFPVPIEGLTSKISLCRRKTFLRSQNVGGKQRSNRLIDHETAKSNP
jgi:hypothetical protein